MSKELGIRIPSACRIAASLPNTLCTSLAQHPTEGATGLSFHSLSFHWTGDSLLTRSLLALATRGRMNHKNKFTQS